MKITNIAFKSFLTGFLLLNTALAAKITNIQLQPNGNQLFISWDALDAETMKDADGYAVQWSDRTSDIDIQTYARLYQGSAPQVFSTSGNRVTLTLGRFDRNITQYLRVYTYKTSDNNKKYLGNGSDRIKWKVDGFDKVETETTVVTDPVIVVDDTTSDAELVNIDFGSLRILEYDNFADFYWSKPSLALASDYDGFIIEISTQANLEDEANTTQLIFEPDTDEVRITGLLPNTNYYAQGHVFKAQGGENKILGSSDAKSFKTIEAIPRDGSSVASRNLAKIERKPLKKFPYGTDLEADTTTTTSSTTSTTAATPVTTTTSTINNTVNSDDEKRDRIRAIQSQIRSLERERSTLQTQLGQTPTVSTQSTYANTTTTTSTSSGQSTRDRVRAALAARRNK